MEHNSIIILGPDGKPIKSLKEAPCPKCGRGSNQRVPSGGFGTTWWICKCGYEFNKELLCPKAIL